MFISKIERETFSTPVNVYCLTAEKTGNFLLDAGVVVHNSGPIRQVRTRNQGLLPLTGKVANAAKMAGDKVLMSKAILNILAAIGFDPKHADPLSKLQVGKIILLADPDPDGAHINCLLLTLFAKYMPDLFAQGKIYIADAPEFYAIYKDQLFVGDQLSQVQAKLVKAKVKAEVHHVKGWGEVDPQIIKAWVVDPQTRKLIKLKGISAEDSTEFEKWMGRDASARREGVSRENNE